MRFCPPAGPDGEHEKIAIRKAVAGVQVPKRGEGERGAKLPYRRTDAETKQNTAMAWSDRTESAAKSGETNSFIPRIPA